MLQKRKLKLLGVNTSELMSNKSSFTRFLIIQSKFCKERIEANFNIVGFHLRFPSYIFCFISFAFWLISSPRRTCLQISFPLKVAGESTLFGFYLILGPRRQITFRRLVMSRYTWSRNGVNTYIFYLTSPQKGFEVAFPVHFFSHVRFDFDSILSMALNFPLIQSKIFNNIWNTYRTFC